MSHHRHPTCPISGKLRYRELRDIKLALREASWDRSRARVNEAVCSRREIRGYLCSDCGGWHLTSQRATSTRYVPVTNRTVRRPGPAAEAIRRIASATGLKIDTAA